MAILITQRHCLKKMRTAFGDATTVEARTIASLIPYSRFNGTNKRKRNDEGIFEHCMILDSEEEVFSLVDEIVKEETKKNKISDIFAQGLDFIPVPPLDDCSSITTTESTNEMVKELEDMFNEEIYKNL
jgi:hypothetical protein